MKGLTGFSLLALVTAPVLAGCVNLDLDQASVADDLLGGALPAASLRCPGTAEGACNLLTTMEAERQGNEVTIAVNPTDPGNVVAGAKDYYPESAGQCVWNGLYHTKDGASFTSKSLPGSPWLLATNPGAFEANVLTQYWCATDPVVAFGPDGTLYYSLLAYQGDPVTASKIGKDQLGTGVNDFAFNRVSIAVAISRDGGETIDEISIVDSGTFPVNFHDRQWIEVDRNTGHIYVAWTAIFLPGNLVYKSTDGGRTWSPPVLLNEAPTALHGPGSLFVATGGADGVYVSGCGADGPEITASTDGAATFTGFKTIVNMADEGMEAEYRGGRICMVAADDTDGPHAGNAYVVFTSTESGHRDVYFTRSEDRGATWSEPVRLPKDDSGNDKAFPAISVNPNGVVDVAWYDRRNDPENRLLDVYHVYSPDGGRTWSENFRVTEFSSDPSHSKHQGGFTFIGDYIDMDSSVDCAWPVWVDTRNGKADVMTACVERPGDAVAATV